MPSSAARLKRSAGRSDCVHGSGSRGVASKAAASSWAARCRSMAIEELNKPASECACGSVWIRIGNSSRGALHVPVWLPVFTGTVPGVVLARAVSATPPSIATVALVLGGPESVRALC